jgi:tetraacyldisaccharide 4'-kinase
VSYTTQKIRLFANYLWYRHSTLATILSPLSWLFRLLLKLRRFWLQKRQRSLPTPVVVVGNISVGGTGKSPVVIALAIALKAKGYRPGIISRGHGSHAPYYPFRVNQNTLVGLSGDEPLMIARQTQCPVMIGADRYTTALTLLAQFSECDIIISDDGLQHYNLPRALEIAVVDGERGFGNGHCLPVGPLREPIDRLDTVDWIIVNNGANKSDNKLQQYIADRQSAARITSITVQPKGWLHIQSNTLYPLLPLPWLSYSQHRQNAGVKIKAIASIGNPQRFFSTLIELGLSTETHAFPDHHSFTYSDLAGWQQDIVLMTSKDAVKCQTFASCYWWALEIETQLPSDLITAVSNLTIAKK